MARKIRFRGFPEGEQVLLSASQGGISRGPVSVSAWKSAPSSVSASIERHPTGNVLPGEVVLFYVTGTSGFTGSDEYEELDFEWDFGDSGSTYTVAQDLPSSDRNTDYGRVVSHAYTTTGAKTVTVTMRDHATGQVGTATIPVTVDDPDSDVAWDHDLYVDFGEVSGTPDFTGAPAAGGAVQHISSAVDLYSVSASFADTDKSRITFKKGETFTLTSSIDTRGRTYFVSSDGFGSGARPKMLPGHTNYSVVYVFNSRDVQDNHFACYGIDFDGTYNPVTGIHEGGSNFEAVRTIANTGPIYLRDIHFRRQTDVHHRSEHSPVAPGPSA